MEIWECSTLLIKQINDFNWSLLVNSDPQHGTVVRISYVHGEHHVVNS